MAKRVAALLRFIRPVSITAGAPGRESPLLTIHDQIAGSDLAPEQPVEFITDGLVHRYQIKGDRPGSRNGWYIGFSNGIVAGSWKTNQKQVFVEGGRHQAPEKDERQIQAVIEQARLKREKAQRKAAVAATELWLSSSVADSSHP